MFFNKISLVAFIIQTVKRGSKGKEMCYKVLATFFFLIWRNDTKFLLVVSLVDENIGSLPLLVFIHFNNSCTS